MADDPKPRAPQRTEAPQTNAAPAAASADANTDNDATFEGGPADGQSVSGTLGANQPDELAMIDGDRYAKYTKSGDGYKFQDYTDEV